MPEYLPPGITLKDPRNMTADHILQSLNFWREREIVHGASQAFRWTAYVDQSKQIVPAQYDRRVDLDRMATSGRQKKLNRIRAREVLAAGIMIPEPDVQQFDDSGHPPELNPRVASTHNGASREHDSRSISVASTGYPGIGGPDIPFTLNPTVAGINSDEVSDSNIDPSLLHSSAIATSDPHETNYIQIDGISVATGYTIVTMEVMGRLQDIGVSTPQPVNGPGEGLPRYIVRLDDVARLPCDTENQHGTSIIPPGAGQVHSPGPKRTLNNHSGSTKNTSPKKKRTTNSNSLTLAEAVKFTGDVTLTGRKRRGKSIPAGGVVTRASGRVTSRR